MKSHYRVVIIGGGIVGSSILYHLSKFGWTDVALIERQSDFAREFRGAGAMTAELARTARHRLTCSRKRGLSLAAISGGGKP